MELWSSFTYIVIYVCSRWSICQVVTVRGEVLKYGQSLGFTEAWTSFFSLKWARCACSTPPVSYWPLVGIRKPSRQAEWRKRLSF